jgi:hypothetical protein
MHKKNVLSVSRSCIAYTSPLSTDNLSLIESFLVPISSTSVPLLSFQYCSSSEHYTRDSHRGLCRTTDLIQQAAAIVIGTVNTFESYWECWTRQPVLYPCHCHTAGSV